MSYLDEVVLAAIEIATGLPNRSKLSLTYLQKAKYLVLERRADKKAKKWKKKTATLTASQA